MITQLTLALATIIPVLLISGLVRDWKWASKASPWKPEACFLSNSLAINMTLKAEIKAPLKIILYIR